MDRPAIIKKGVRILRPQEYEDLLEAIPNEGARINLRILLYTGVRYVEAERLLLNPQWFDSEAGKILMPPEAQRKERELDEIKDNRVIYTTQACRDLLPTFFKGSLPVRGGWDQNLKRWAKKAKLDPLGICAKTTRKTWESWLLSFYGEGIMISVCTSQGHSKATSMEHYTSDPFSESDRERISGYVGGWNGFRKKV
jgi:integrase